MTKEEYILLYEKCASGRCTEEESRQLAEYSDEFSLEDADWDTEALGNEKEVADHLYADFHKRRLRRPLKLTSYLYKYAAAAVVFIILGSGLYIYLTDPAKRPESKDQVAAQTDVSPGVKKAILILDDGSKIELDQSTTGVLSSRGNITITKTKTGQVIYNSSINMNNDSQPVKYNSISVPRGGEYELQLSDNTKVWLNSESSLKFPANFTGSERRVELTGEAYFEVAENKAMPFRVVANHTEVEVLGTHFNVNAYHRSQVNTALLEGSVRLKNDSKTVLLKPGEQGLSSANGKLKVSPVNTQDAVAWKNGYFVFQDESIYSIMEKAARWYDVEVEYSGRMEGMEFYAKVTRYGQISELLKNLELTGLIKFKVSGRRVTVMPK